MLENDYLTGRVGAISVSDSENLAVAGFTPLHLADAFGELCRHIMADGGALLYGGDLREKGYTNLLFELIERYRPNAEGAQSVFTSVLPWPVHMSIPDSHLAERRALLPRGSQMICLSKRGEVIRPENNRFLHETQPSVADWHEGLSSMRRFATEHSDFRILLGGRTRDYKGELPGLAEEALIYLQAGKPIFLAGGFGGCTADICAAMGLLPKSKYQSNWNPPAEFSRSYGLNNGLTDEENFRLAGSPHIDEVIALILRGTTRLFRAK